MRIAGFGLFVLFLGACGPSYGGQDVKTPEELVEEQERLAEEQEKKAAQQDQGEAGETDLEKRKKFDKKQADLELKRATRSAESCVGVVTEAGPKGKATVTLKFGNDGHVKESSIDSQFGETAVGKCALRAFDAVIVPAFEGDEEVVTWEVDLSGEKKAE